MAHKVRAVPLDDVVDAADIWMRDLPAQTHVIVKATEEDRIARQASGEKLQSDRLIELGVVGAIDLAHAAAAENAGDAVTTGDDRPRRKLRFDTPMPRWCAARIAFD